jgi:hypothetical protein
MIIMIKGPKREMSDLHGQKTIIVRVAHGARA